MTTKKIIQSLSFVLAAIIVILSFSPGVFASEILNSFTSTDEGEFENADQEVDFEDNIVIVRLKKEYSDPDVEVTPEAFPELDVTEVVNYAIADPDENFVRDLCIVLAEHSKVGVLEACELLNSREDIGFTEPSYIIEIEYDGIPNDPEFDQGYPYIDEANNIYETRNNKMPYILIGAPEAWAIETGSTDIKVGVLDSNVSKHTDLNDNLTTGYDFLHNNTITNDGILEHGTQISSIIGAKGNNNSFSTGVCWDVNIVPMQIGTHKGVTIREWGNVFDYLKENDINIINCSFGSHNAELLGSFSNYIEAWGGILVASAGNNNNNNDERAYYPSSLPSEHIISVAAYNYDATGLASGVDWGHASSESGRGSNYGAESVDIAAPGTNVYVLEGMNDSTYVNGTSFSAPFVAGAAALLKSAYPEATSLEIIKALKLGCQHYDWTIGKVKYGCLRIDKSLEVLSKIIDNRDIDTDSLYTYGELVSLSDTDRDISISSENSVILSDFATNGRTTLRFENVDEDHLKISEKESGLVLDCVGGELLFSASNSSYSQEWRMNKLEDNSFVLTNVTYNKVLKYSNNSLSLVTYSGSQDEKFTFYRTGDVTFDLEVTSDDVDRVRKFTSNVCIPTVLEAYLADVNEDGILNMKDILILSKYIAGIGQLFPQQN